jgi:hypothetical protein
MSMIGNLKRGCQMPRYSTTKAPVIEFFRFFRVR